MGFGGDRGVMIVHLRANAPGGQDVFPAIRAAN